MTGAFNQNYFLAKNNPLWSRFAMRETTNYICSGEMQKVRGEKVVNGSISYVAQQAWIQNLTLKDNILFSSR